MDRTRRFPTGLLCGVIWRSTMGFHSKSIRFEGWRASTSDMIGLKRTGKSCRLRWVNYLHPGLKRGKMTPQEERLVLELHSKWGNRWSRIARKLPGRTDNEIKNFWRTHLRKLAQEKKRAILSPSSSSNCSLSSNNPTVDSLPSIEIGEESFYDTGGHVGDDTVTEQKVENRHEEEEEEEEEDDQEDNEKGFSYSMDDIWRDIDQSVIKPVCNNEQFCNFSCPPMASPPWEYGLSQYSPWKMAEEDNKLFLPIPPMNYDQHGETIALR